MQKLISETIGKVIGKIVGFGEEISQLVRYDGKRNMLSETTNFVNGNVSVKNRVISYSWDQIDLLILDIFQGGTGFYVEIGGFDPIFSSNTKLLYDLGWNGVSVDAIKEYVDLHQKERPLQQSFWYAVNDLKTTNSVTIEYCKLTNFDSVYSRASTDSTFNELLSVDENQPSVSLSNLLRLARYIPSYVYSYCLNPNTLVKVNTPTININDILADAVNDRDMIDVLILDAEGYDLKILHTVNFDLHFPKVIVFESEHYKHINNLPEFVLANYEFIFDTKKSPFAQVSNTILAKSNFIDTLQHESTYKNPSATPFAYLYSSILNNKALNIEKIDSIYTARVNQDNKYDVCSDSKNIILLSFDCSRDTLFFKKNTLCVKQYVHILPPLLDKESAILKCLAEKSDEDYSNHSCSILLLDLELSNMCLTNGLLVQEQEEVISEE